jgi:hypothetical protein
MDTPTRLQLANLEAQLERAHARMTELENWIRQLHASAESPVEPPPQESATDVAATEPTEP